MPYTIKRDNSHAVSNMQCKRRENSKMPNEIKRKLKNAGSTVLNIMKERKNKPSERSCRAPSACSSLHYERGSVLSTAETGQEVEDCPVGARGKTCLRRKPLAPNSCRPGIRQLPRKRFSPQLFLLPLLTKPLRHEK